MKGMKSAQEYFQAAPPGRYPSRIVACEATVAKSGASMLKLTNEILAPAQLAGQQADDYIITDGSAKGGGMGKQKLRGLGVNVDTDDEIPDAVLAQGLLGLQLDVEYGNEPKMTRSVADGPYDKEMTVIDGRTGQTVVLQKLIVKGYFRHSAGGVVAQAPVQQLAQAPVQQVAPQGYAPQALPQQFAPQAPQGFAPQQPAFAPQAMAPAFAPQGAPGTPAIAPWALTPGNGVAAPAPSAEGGKKKAKKLDLAGQEG